MATSAATQRVALITGGSRGIGLGIARSLVQEGLRLAINGVRPAEDLGEILEGLDPSGERVTYARGDISSADDRQAIVDHVFDRFGRIDVLVNNAGITSPGRNDILEADEASFDRVVAINLKGPYFLTQLVANRMIAAPPAEGFRRVIINVSSISAEFVSTNRGDYCLTKAALGMATKLWAVRLAEHDIDVYEIRPGVIRSDMTAGVADKYDRMFREGLTLERRWGEPEDIGRAAAALVRGDLPYATGQVLKIDGGMTIRSL